ncbi:hypothetical protein ACFFOM_11550 [Microlunatus capsulatus]|uniref:Serine/threonine protein kinase n=1 Tax=Microlunatus capsulatus TaxID=99117 RepID=A0ABS4Z9F1_9ACTN|nr:hypothetical protein [Microlunatus capsulatus]MBP2417621.1 hypothetical protein [Microlunatus capsulatus]
MSDLHPLPVPTRALEQGPAPAAAAAAEPTTTPPGRARRWLAGTVLVTVGLVAGAGATYAFTDRPAATWTDPGPGSAGVDRRGTDPAGPPPGPADPAGPGTTTDGEPT